MFKKTDIRMIDLVDGGRKWALSNKDGEWSIEVKSYEYKFSYNNLRTCDFHGTNPFRGQICKFFGKAAEVIDELVWGDDGNCSLMRGILLNRALVRGMYMPPELWSRVRTWIKRNYDWTWD